MKYNWCCTLCGEKHGTRVPKLATWHQGICDICGKNGYVTELRDFGISKFKGEDTSKER